MRGAGAQPVDDIAYLWPDNQRAWDCWLALQTQWRIGHQGATGLDYAGVRAWLLDQVADDTARRDIWRAVQACEGACLEVWAEQRQQREQERQQHQP